MFTNLPWMLWTLCAAVLIVCSVFILYLLLRREPVPGSVFHLEIGGMTAEELEKSLDREKINVSSYARSMLWNTEAFVEPVNQREQKRQGKTETLDLMHLCVRDLGFTSPPTTKGLFARAKQLGLELCPPETGPYLRLADKAQPPGWYYIGMEPIADCDGDANVFRLERDADGLWLYRRWAHPDRQWDLDFRIVFRVRPPERSRAGKWDA